MMNMKNVTLGILTISAAALAGCAVSKPALQGQINPEFGAAVKANQQAQFAAPTPTQKANIYIPADGTRAAAARKNYRDNTVPDPERLNP